MAIRILCVDDEPNMQDLMLQMFSKKIREGVYEFQFALNGRQALDLIRTSPDFDVLLTDINMPEMDGLSLLSEIPGVSPLLKGVIVTAYGDWKNIRTAMNRGAFDFITKPFDYEDLERTINKTADLVRILRAGANTLEENRILKMHVDSTNLDHLLAAAETPHGKTIEGAVLFVDICGFTTLSEQESPDTIMKLLAQYFDCIVLEISNKGGSVDKFIGDAVMAVFQGEDYLRRALNASLVIRQSIQNLGIARQAGFDFYPNVSIGLNWGEMILGNIGSTQLGRVDFTVIGDTVNTAARLQGSAGEGDILVLNKSADRLAELYELEDRGELTLKNKTGAFRVSNVVNLRPN